MTALSQIPKYISIPKSVESLSQSQRLFHGRGHAFESLSHVTIDWLPPVILITLFAEEAMPEIEILAGKLLFLFPLCLSVQLQHRYLQSGPIDLIRGESYQDFTVWEDNLQFHISLGKVRNTGLFLDMRNGRKWVLENSANKRVLNLFAYTCGFSVAAIAGQAHSVINVDMSSAALNVGRENHRLNQHDLKSVSFEKINIFKSFGRFKKKGPFDLLICDPPTFQKGSVDIKRDYPKILRRLNEFMAVKSTLVLCLNAPELGEDFLMEHMSALAPDYILIDHISAPEVYQEKQEKGLTVLCFRRH